MAMRLLLLQTTILVLRIPYPAEIKHVFLLAAIVQRFARIRDFVLATRIGSTEEGVQIKHGVGQAAHRSAWHERAMTTLTRVDL